MIRRRDGRPSARDMGPFSFFLSLSIGYYRAIAGIYFVRTSALISLFDSCSHIEEFEEAFSMTGLFSYTRFNVIDADTNICATLIWKLE